MLQQARKTISRYNMFPAASRVAVAVSGGADSVCALLALVELAPELRIQVSVAHFNHKLRGEASDGDEKFVSELAERFGLPFHRAEANVGDSTDNLEQAGRRARKQFFAELILNKEAHRIATGHTRDDQAETVLFRILRGSGLTGLAGILPVTSDGIRRPLIEVTRAEVETFLRERGQGWREDASNRESRFARNRIRKALLPQLETEWNPQLSALLARMADLAFEENLWVEALSKRELTRIVKAEIVKPENDAVEFRAGDVQALPRGLARRVIRGALGRAKGDLRRLEFSHVEQVLELAFAKAGEGSVNLPGVSAERSFDWIRLSAAGAPEPAVLPVRLSVPGNFVAADGTKLRLTAEDHPAPGFPVLANGATLKAAVLDRPGLADSNGTGLELRGWRRGDHYQSQGRSGDEKVSEMFQRAKVPSWRRHSWPIVTYRDTILWAKAFGPAAEFAADAETVRVLRIIDD